MKQLFNATVLAAIFSITSLFSIAQEPQPSTSKYKWVSDKGYWVIESNVNNRKSATIHFYNNDHTKLYSEKVEGRVINLNKRKTLMQLKQALDSSLLAWNTSKQVNNELVKHILSGKQRNTTD